MRFRGADDLIETLTHDVLQALVHFAFTPEKSLTVLDPLEITDGYAAGIAQNVGDNENSLAVDNFVGVGSYRTVGAFAENLAIDARGVLGRDLIFGRRRNQNVGGMEEDVLGGLFFAAGREIRQGPALFVNPVDELGDVKTLLVVEPAMNIGDTDNFVARGVHQHSALGTDVAKTLNDDAATFSAHFQFSQRIVAAHHQAAASGFAATLGAAELQRLAGDDGSGGLAGVHGIGVHNPGHGLLVGADVRGRNVALGTKPFAEFGGVAASNAFEFVFGKLGRIADDAALGAAEGNVDHGAFPGHPGGEGADFVDGDVGIEADTALAWATNGGVQDTVTSENLDLATVHADGDVNRDFLAGILQVAVDTVFEAEFLRGGFEARLSRLVNVQFILSSRRHVKPPEIPTTIARLNGELQSNYAAYRLHKPNRGHAAPPSIRIRLLRRKKCVWEFDVVVTSRAVGWTFCRRASLAGAARIYPTGGGPGAIDRDAGLYRDAENRR